MINEKGPLLWAFLFFALAILEKMVYTILAPAGVMGSDGSAACGGISDLSDGQRSIADEGF